MERFDERWAAVQSALKKRFDKETDVKGALFIIGLREWGKKKKKISKEEKQDMMNLAACKILTNEGYFEVQHLDAEGWPVWKQTKALPVMNAKEQEKFIMEHIITYFEEEKLL